MWCSVLLVLGVGSVCGVGRNGYWWMDTEGAFGGNRGQNNQQNNVIDEARYQHGGKSNGEGNQQIAGEGEESGNGYQQNVKTNGRGEVNSGRQTAVGNSNTGGNNFGDTPDARQQNKGNSEIKVSKNVNSVQKAGKKGTNQASPVLPVTQGLVQNGEAQESCPTISSIPPVSACQGRESNCWSVGQTDVDCLDNALCCFDGCANVCQGEGSRPNIPLPQTNARGQQRSTPKSTKKEGDGNQPARKPVPNQNESRQNQPQASPTEQQTSFQSPTSQFKTADPNQNPGYGGGNRQESPTRKSFTAQTTNLLPSSASSSVSGVGGGLLFPLVSANNGGYSSDQGSAQDTGQTQTNSNAVKTNTNTGPVQSKQIVEPSPSFVPPPQVQSSPPQNQPRRPKPTNFQQSQDASSKPYIRCPSAMKCVPKVNCDFEGVMTEEVLDLSPQLDALRVPLIPCINRQRGNAIDVCCRDPNYQDPWPQQATSNLAGDQQPGRQGQNNKQRADSNLAQSQANNQPNSQGSQNRKPQKKSNAYG